MKYVREDPCLNFTGSQKSEELSARNVVSKSGIGEFPLVPVVALQAEVFKSDVIGPDGEKRRKSAGEVMEL